MEINKALVDAIIKKDLVAVKDAIERRADINCEFRYYYQESIPVTYNNPTIGPRIVHFNDEDSGHSGKRKMNCNPLSLCIAIGFQNGYNYILSIGGDLKFSLYHALENNDKPILYQILKLKKYNFIDTLFDIYFHSYILLRDSEQLMFFIKFNSKFLTIITEVLNEPAVYKTDFIKNGIPFHIEVPTLNDIVPVLLNIGADSTTITTNGYTLLHHAANAGNIGQVIKILAIDQPIIQLEDLINKQTLDTGKTALMLATNKEVAELLIDKGADVNITDKAGNTAKFYASDELKKLFKSGLSIEEKARLYDELMANK